MAATDEETASDSEQIEALIRQVAAAPTIEPAPELVPLTAGAVVAETYRIEGRIGVGGMGVVYRATDIRLGRRVALKLHRRRPEADPLDRLMREASVMARLSHPNVVTVFEVGQHREPSHTESRLFIAMEYVDGGSVAAWAEVADRSWRAVLDVFLQAGDGLAAAHAAGVVHRDFKPDNVLIDAAGRARVADFGLARLGPEHPTRDPTLDSAAAIASGSETREGQVLGTPAYMAPEQWIGERGTAASDQYAFCVSLFEMLYGHNPAAAIRAHEGLAAGEPSWDPPRRSAVPTRILRTLRRGLATVPGDRFASMDDLLAALRHDPWRRGARLILGLAVVGLGGGLSWALTRTPAHECDARSEIETVWNETTRKAVVDHLGGEDPRYARAAASVAGLLDDYAAVWAEEHDDACRSERTDDQAFARRACLRAQRRRFAVLVPALARVDAKGRSRAVSAAAELPSPTACSTATRLPEPGDGPSARSQEAIERGLDELGAAVALGDAEKAEARIAALRPEVEEADAPDLRARFSLLQGRFGSDHEDAARGIAALDRALAAALRSQDAQLLAKVAADLSIELASQGRIDEAERALLIGDAAADRTEPEVRTRLRLSAARTAVYDGRDRYEEAVAEASAAVALARAELGEDHPRTASTLDILGVPLRALHRYDEALEANAHAIEIATNTYGREHPVMADLLVGRGALEYSTNRPTEAIESLREALRLYQAFAGPAAPPTVRTAANLASGLLSVAADRGTREGEIEEARSLLEPIARQLEAEGRVDERGNELFWDNLGAVAIKTGRPEEAIRYIRRSLDGLEAAYGPDSVRLGPALTKLASAQLDLERFDDARATMVRALKIATDAGAQPANIARIHVLLGQVERKAGNLAAAREAILAGRAAAESAGVQVLVDRADQELTKVEEAEEGRP